MQTKELGVGVEDVSRRLGHRYMRVSEAHYTRAVDEDAYRGSSGHHRLIERFPAL